VWINCLLSPTEEAKPSSGLAFNSICLTRTQVKLGIDPTGTDIHLGHSIPVRKLRAFQDVFSSTKMTGMGLLSNTVCEIEPIKTLSKG